MSYKFLDLSGLSYFWDKVKARLNGKQDTLVSGTNIKTINNNSILGSGNMELFEGLTFLSYGKSTWNDFITAYNKQAVVYCRASSSSNPASGSQTRLAFMAYVNNAENPTNVEFQYYRSMSSHSATNQGDQVYVYKLESANGGKWTVTTREASTKIVAGTNMSSSYSNGVLTLSSSGGSSGTATDVQINGTSIVSNNAANIVTNTAYNASTNKLATMEDVSSNSDYIIEFPSSWSSVIDEYEQAGSPDDFSVDILANTYSGIDSDHEHYFVNTDLYNVIDRIMQGDIAEVKLNLNNTTYDHDYYVSSAYVSADGNTQLNVLFNDNAYVVSQDLGFLNISGKYETRTVPYFTISCGPSDLTYFYSNAEFTNNKVTSISSSSTNTQYPSALAVYNYINSLNGNGVSY